MNKLSIDSNAYSALASGNSAIMKVISEADELIIPFVVLAELLYGFKYGSREKRNLTVLNAFRKANEIEIIHSTSVTVELYADINKQLRLVGRPIRTNDSWIAALTIENNAQLLTADRHFDPIIGLRTVGW